LLSATSPWCIEPAAIPVAVARRVIASNTSGWITCRTSVNSR